MAARAIYKAVIRFADVRVPVKLYAAVQDRAVHFRLLHRKDHSPVKQVMVNPVSGDSVAYADAKKAWIGEDGTAVMLDREELAELAPPASRDVDVIAFLPPAAIDHRWYDRPYYLGPDGDRDQYTALAEALAAEDRAGLVRWSMRSKGYIGALESRGEYLMLISLRHAEEVIDASDLQAPRGRALDDKELAMARQLMDMLAADFEPTDYVDEHRQRVLELVAAKARGHKIEQPRARRRREPSEDLGSALQASLAAARRQA